MTSQYFIGGIMPDPAIPMQPRGRVIEIRPFRGGWQYFEAEGVARYWRGRQAKQDAIGYAMAPAKLNADFRLAGNLQSEQAIAAEAW